MDWDGAWDGGFPDEIGEPGSFMDKSSPSPAPPSQSAPMEPDTLEPTWWVLDREPGMDDLAGTSGEVLKKMKDDLKIFPFQDRGGNDRLFLARFEFPKDGETFKFPEAVFAPGKVAGWIDFLAGVPVDDVEMMVAIGEYSTKKDKVAVKDGAGKAAAPVPKKFFDWPDRDKVLFNLTAIPTKNIGKMLAKNLSGEPAPAKAHWWFRYNLVGDTANPQRFPVPGEFVGLGVRLMPTVSWGKQKSSPFVWSGNWCDTVYYTGAVITEVIDPTNDVPYPTYKVKWRKDEISVNPSDFALYKVGDRVTILKDVATDKKTQTWKDDDVKTPGDTWMIAPICFYGLEKET